MSARKIVRFAHPLEEELARVFDQLGIAWEYEPRTFVLERKNGRVSEACTPDFYLMIVLVVVSGTVLVAIGLAVLVAFLVYRLA